MSEQLFITLVNCIMRGLNRNGKQIIMYVTKTRAVDVEGPGRLYGQPTVDLCLV
ncbi:hypothetical protein F443_13703 [Phytophthora nicotianae P1569]|uniref:Uncharacterized protein n=2 Tax=Phytophthora nicotianae TaxID=4792 RepID=V9EP49_PHYNI|nr:hypothetical protein F443_13703 [Phytophthora nicotianae P1569]ETO58781.1 hypothetical protein F444_22835 [Phytophthora nicotianae P1976]